jgi:hypothetical protein
VSISISDLNLLIAAGIPLAGEHEASGHPVDFAALRSVMLKILAASPEPKMFDALRGWMIAVQDHYPTIFDRYFQGPEIQKLIESPVTGRDIKLRRIALSHLGKIA